jgi:cellulose synthase/poly-beta-1,6-N-acetylglucosamine synthase-like glycosyltransferase
MNMSKMKNITVGICAYNEDKSIMKSLESIISQINKKDEIIVVASACTDNTCKIVRDYAKHDKRIKLVEEKQRKGKGEAQNKIAQKAKNDIIVFTDADLVLEKDAIKHLLSGFKSSSVGAVMGKTIPYSTDNFFAKTQAFAWKVLDEKRKIQSDNGSLFSLNGYLFAIRKNLFSKIDVHSTVEDAYLGWKIKQKGFSIVYIPESKVLVNPAHTLNDYISEKKRVRYGWWQMHSVGMKLNEKMDVRNFKYLFTDLHAWPYLLLDIYVWFDSFLDFKLKKKKLNEEWEKIDSSKI